MDKIRELIAHKLYVSDWEVSFYSYCFRESEQELMEYILSGYLDENCEILCNNCVYYRDKLLKAINDYDEYSRLAKRLGLN